MAFIDCVVWEPDGHGPTVYAYKYPQTNLSTATQLIVHESQEAVLFSKGQLMGKFGPGKRTLTTENLPLLRSLYGIPFGGKNPFMAEVWFVNKVQVFNINWDFGNMSIHDADYQTMLPLSASGQYGLRIVDTERFLIKVVGTRPVFTEIDMTQQFRGEFTTKAKSAILKFMTMNNVGFKQISAYLSDLSDHLHAQLAPFWQDLGLELTRFYVSDIEIDDSTAEGRAIREAMADQSAQRISGHTWQQRQIFDTANNAIGSLSGSMSGGGLLGGLMAINMMNSMGSGSMPATMMQPQYDQPGFGPSHQPGQGMGGNDVRMPGGNVRMVYCADCARQFPSTSEFCPNCGKKYNPCPRCGSDNSASARRCVACGTQLGGAAGSSCASCGHRLSPGAAFCPGCGRPTGQADSNICSRCGSKIPPTAKFCPRCGNKK